MEEKHFLVCGEVSEDEDARRLLNTMSIGNILKPKMSLEELIVASHDIYNEVNEFEARWANRVDTFTYKVAINLIFAEIDKYPTIKKYNKNKQEDLQTDLAVGIAESLGYSLLIDWSFIKSRLIDRLTPNRWV